jgi:hypothetical protein
VLRTLRSLVAYHGPCRRPTVVTGDSNRPPHLTVAPSPDIVGEKLRSDSKEAGAALARQGRYHTVAGNLRVKQVRIDDGTARDRFVICHNPERADRDQLVREQILDRRRPPSSLGL